MAKFKKDGPNAEAYLKAVLAKRLPQLCNYFIKNPEIEGLENYTPDSNAPLYETLEYCLLSVDKKFKANIIRKVDTAVVLSPPSALPSIHISGIVAKLLTFFCQVRYRVFSCGFKLTYY